jgi:hypothetical protein
MAGIFPNPSASATDFKVGDNVKWFISEKMISPYVGVVTHVCPKTNKVWVEFPIGGNQQRDPSELILVPYPQGISPVTEDTGYESYEKILSEKNRGTIKKSSVLSDDLKKKASKIANNFANEVVSKIASDIVDCIKEGKTDIQTYYNIYPIYKNICSDGFIKYAISKIYNLKKG